MELATNGSAYQQAFARDKPATAMDLFWPFDCEMPCVEQASSPIVNDAVQVTTIWSARLMI
jgi:hypothetical protein